MSITTDITAGDTFISTPAPVPFSPDGGQVWANPGNALSSNDVRATVNVEEGIEDVQVTEYLLVTGFGFTTLGFAPHDLVMGLEVLIERRVANKSSSFADARDLNLRIYLGGAFQTNSIGSTLIDWPETDTIRIYKDVADDFAWNGGSPPTMADITEAGFGFGISARYNLDLKDPSQSNLDCEIDTLAMKIRVVRPPVERRVSIMGD